MPLLWEVTTSKHCVSPTVRATAAFKVQGVYNSVCLSLTNRSFLTADHKALKQSWGLFSSIFNDTSSLNTAINCLSSRSQEVTCFLSLSATSNLPSDLYETSYESFYCYRGEKASLRCVAYWKLPSIYLQAVSQVPLLFLLNSYQHFGGKAFVVIQDMFFH